MTEFDPSEQSHDAKAMAEYLDKVSDVLGGLESMRRNWKQYVKQFPRETDARYEMRRDHADMTNVFGDVLDSLASKPFSHDVEVVNATNAIQPLIDDIDGRGNNLSVFAAQVFYQGIADSITWLRIDYPDAQEFASEAEENAAGVRPYWVHVKHADILEIKSSRKGGGEFIEYLRMWESKRQIIEMWLDSWRRWHKDDKGEWVVKSEGVISIGIVPMVPFITGKREGNKWIFRPPLRDALNDQIELFKAQSSLNFASALTAFSPLSANGVKPKLGPDGKTPLPIEIGPDSVLYAPPDSNGNYGSWERVPPGTEGLKFLADQIEKRKLDLREVGKQPLTAQSGNLTRISAMAASSKSNSAVQAWAMALKDALEQALVVTGMWMNDATDYDVSVFTDFRATDDDDATPQIIISLFQAGAISRKTALKELKNLGRLSESFDIDAEDLLIAEQLSNQLIDQ